MTDELLSKTGHEADKYFPFPKYRKGQRSAYYEAYESLYGASDYGDEGRFIKRQGAYDNVILDLPTGVGKSPVCVALSRRATEDAFLTTPQKKLRNQLQSDEDLQEYYKTLKARKDYTCRATGKDCESCPVNNSNDESCFDKGSDCTYWHNKRKAMHNDIAVITFAMLIIDSRIPERGNEGKKISFGDREIGVIDEAHNIEEQVSSLFAGFKISPFGLPEEVFEYDDTRGVDEDVSMFQEVEDTVVHILEKAMNYVQMYDGIEDPEIVRKVERCEKFAQSCKYMLKEVRQEDRPWVVNVDTIDYYGEEWTTLHLKPVKVDRFLKEHIWSRMDKVVLSSATIPFSENIDDWMDRIGLEGETKIIQKEMPFPEDNRLIHTNHSIDKMSQGGDQENWGKILSKIDEISRNNEGKKGLVHTASYSRAKQLHEDLSTDTFLHPEDSDMESEEIIDSWQNSDKQLMLSPSMTEGVDLHDDKCEFQILLKVPYPHGGDSRVSYLLDEGEWDWYYECTGTAVVQSVGRGVRHNEDRCDFYVLDESFWDVMSRCSIPDWFLSAIRTHGTQGPNWYHANYE